jgi:hypothetical protein
VQTAAPAVLYLTKIILPLFPQQAIPYEHLHPKVIVHILIPKLLYLRAIALPEQVMAAVMVVITEMIRVAVLAVTLAMVVTALALVQAIPALVAVVAVDAVTTVLALVAAVVALDFLGKELTALLAAVADRVALMAPAPALTTALVVLVVTAVHLVAAQDMAVINAALRVMVVFALFGPVQLVHFLQLIQVTHDY